MFNPIYEQTFQAFSPSHLWTLFVILFFMVLIVVFRKVLQQPKWQNFLRYFLGVLILLQEIGLHVFRIAVDEWTLQTSLPFHLCGFAVLALTYILFFKKKKLFINTFIIMAIGAVMALATPSIEHNYGFPHIRYFLYFGSHGLILINIFFILFVMDYQKDITYKHVWNNYFALLVLGGIALLFNFLANANYMYLSRKPAADTAFNLFGEYPWYLVNIALFGAPFLIHLFYVPFGIRDLLTKKKEVARI